MSRKFTLPLAKALIILFGFWQQSALGQRNSTAPNYFGQSKSEIEGENTRALNKDNQLKLLQLKHLPTPSEKAVLEAYQCKIIGYKGNNTYLVSISAEKLTSLQRLPWVEKIENYGKAQKAAPEFGKYFPSEAIQDKHSVWIDALTLPNTSLQEIINNLPSEATIEAHYPQFDSVRIKVAKKRLFDLLEQPWLVWAEYAIAEQLQNQLGVTQSRAGALQYHLPHLTGKGVHVGVWDGSAIIGADTHIDFLGRSLPQEPHMGESASWREHATHVSGTIGGAGLRYLDARGIAPEARLFQYNIVSTGTPEGYVPYEMLQAVERNNIVITQNSYGPSHTCSAGGINYSTTNRSQDLVVNAFPQLLHVFAAGNSGGACGGYRNTVNGAKNIISVAGLNAHDARMWVGGNQSSAGPTRDGRLQPHIAALGVDVLSTIPTHTYGDVGWTGTSMAAPHVSGVAALLYQHYRELYGHTPSSDLIRAVLLNGATDLGNPGPDYIFGFGKLNAFNAAAAITETRFALNQVAQGQTHTHYIHVPAGKLQLKIMLSWNDPAALPSATPSPTLVNDLNLQAKSPSSTVFLPLVLNPTTPASPAVQGVDNLNNNEQIVVDLPEEGVWEITVTGAGIAIGDVQPYALTWQIEGEFLALRNPTTHERRLTPVVWDSRGIVGNVTVEFFNGTTWQTLGTAPASQGMFHWTPPTGIVANNARIRISGTGASSASYVDLSPPLQLIDIPLMLPNPYSIPLVAGNNSLTLNWNAVAGADEYEVLWLNPLKATWEVFATVPAPTTTYTATGLQNGMRHWFTVRARNTTLNVTGVYSYANHGTPTGSGPSWDLALIQVERITPAGGCIASSQPQQVRLTLKNQGSSSISAGTTIPLSYRINGGPWTSENFALTTALATGQTTTYTFVQTFTPSTAGQVIIEAKINWSSDEIFTNNSASLQVPIPALPTMTVSATPSLSSCTLPVMVQINGVEDDGYQLQAIDFQPENMSAATEISLSNDGASGAIPIGFPFKFYNRTFTHAYISAEGFLTFRKVDFDYINFLQRTIPNPLIVNDFIALAWTNLRFATTSKVRYQTVGTAPLRKFIVEFFDMVQENDLSKTVSGQIMLYESFNRIELHIGRIEASPVSKFIAGIENFDGTAGVAIPGINNQHLTANVVEKAWAFVPVASQFEWLDNGSHQTSRLFTATGTYTFRYQREDCLLQQQIIVCNNVPAIAPITDVTTLEDTPVSTPVLITYGILPETLLTISQASNNPTLIPNSNLVWSGTGASRQLQLTPLPNQHGTAQITITATDGVHTATRTFQLTVNPVNDAPTVNNFTVSMFENSIYSFTLAKFTAHYSDVENDPLAAIKILTLPVSGTLKLAGVPISVGTVIPATQIWQLSYHPSLHFTGTVHFQWTAFDGTDWAIAPATTTIQITKPPEPVLPIPTIEPILNVTTLEDTPITLPVRIHYGELSDQLLRIEVFAANPELLPRQGFYWLGIDASRRLLIVPAPNAFGETEVTLWVSNGKNTASVKFKVRVLPVNDAPTTKWQNIRVKSGNLFAFDAKFFDSLYWDVEGDSLQQIRIDYLPQNGRLLVGGQPIQTVPVTVSRRALSQLVYQPLQEFTGKDFFTWQAFDGVDWSNAARVEIAVWNTAPKVIAFQKRVHWRKVLQLRYSHWAVHFHDADGDPLKAIQLWGQLGGNWRHNGRVIGGSIPIPLDSTQEISFYPSAFKLGVQRFAWTAFDGTEWAEPPAILEIQVWNTPPQVSNFTAEGVGSIALSLATFAAHYADADGDSLKSIQIQTLPKRGQLLWRGIPLQEPFILPVDQLHHLTYQPLDEEQTTTDTLYWKAFDGAQWSDVGLLNLQSQPLLRPKVFSFDKQTFENQPLAFLASDFVKHFSYGNSSPDFIRLESLPFYGVLRIQGQLAQSGKNYSLSQIGSMVYYPRTDFIGFDSFEFTAGVGNTIASKNASVTIQVMLQEISAPLNLRLTGTQLTWEPPQQGNVQRYEVQVQLKGTQQIVVHDFTTHTFFTLPSEWLDKPVQIHVRAWGYHHNAGPFATLELRSEMLTALPSSSVKQFIKIFPNPAPEKVFLQWENMQNASIRLIDLTGKVIYEGSLTTATGVEELSSKVSFASGWYVLQVEHFSGNQEIKFLINK